MIVPRINLNRFSKVWLDKGIVWFFLLPCFNPGFETFGQSAPYPFQDTRVPLDRRAEDLVSRLTLEEKLSQLHATLTSQTPSIERLNIPEFKWCNEGLHGVTCINDPYESTCFPQAIGMAASWHPELLRQVADAISDEARARFHHLDASGLTFYTPNINIVRDPRWGRAMETYGEDPFLTSRMGVAMVTGLQGNNPDYLKLVACPKHFASHNGPEAIRDRFNASVCMRDLFETYLPAFKACIVEAKAQVIMPAYNRINGEPCTTNAFLLQNVLRDQWGFQGFTSCDDHAINEMVTCHKVFKTVRDAAIKSMIGGCDFENGPGALAELKEAVEQGQIEEKLIDQAVKRVFTARFRLGLFDPPDKVPYTKIPLSVIGSPKHRQLSLQMARESIVLLKNENGMLPLKKNLKTIAVIGPNTDDLEVQLANYYWSKSIGRVTILNGIRDYAYRLGDMSVFYSRGTGWIAAEDPEDDEESIAIAKLVASKADIAVMVLGLSGADRNKHSRQEGEFIDRKDIYLPEIQEKLLKAVHSTGTPVVLLLLNGAPVTSVWAQEHIPAIVEAWYPGQEGGTAVAEVLFGDYNPAGRLPVTVYRSMEQIPDFENYSMEGRTYRFFEQDPLYAFGFGLSYTKFHYTDLTLSSETVSAAGSITVKVNLSNIGDCTGDEVVQMYVKNLRPAVRAPLRSLIGFQRIGLKPGESKIVTFTLKPADFPLYDDDGNAFVQPGRYELSIGGSQPQNEGNPGRVSNNLKTCFEVKP